jgi:peptidoglycan-N-acetylglucosamine deacetylase
MPAVGCLVERDFLPPGRTRKKAFKFCWISGIFRVTAHLMNLSAKALSRRRFLGGLVLGACALPAARMAAQTRALVIGAPAPAPPLKLAYNSISTTSPVLALTFDDGPHKTNTPRLLDILKSRDVKATFYVIGRNVEAEPDIAKRIVDEGHEIANHTWTHPQLSRLSSSRVATELEKTHEIIEKVTGITTASMRPPYGAVNDRVRQIARKQLDYTTIMWSVDPLDWKYRNSERVSRKLVEGAAPGAILLSHDIHASTVSAMPSCINQLLDKGFRFTTVNSLLRMDQAAAVSTNAG